MHTLIVGPDSDRAVTDVAIKLTGNFLHYKRDNAHPLNNLTTFPIIVEIADKSVKAATPLHSHGLNGYAAPQHGAEPCA